ncbi:MAG: hypothetical protein MRERV_4c041 [Mycoplasmataceae bacterium RV_VA103A]|nr:MAG: hypothetical protein MRERV_11c004 [Mycoplasmataceae bacterium RV_VA103A]KLL05150.1 MAG: hypothetical protein MRERV_4c041 [Mycoplasmataceae bacterium RV_VA103A]
MPFKKCPYCQAKEIHYNDWICTSCLPKNQELMKQTPENLRKEVIRLREIVAKNEVLNEKEKLLITGLNNTLYSFIQNLIKLDEGNVQQVLEYEDSIPDLKKDYTEFKKEYPHICKIAYHWLEIKEKLITSRATINEKIKNQEEKSKEFRKKVEDFLQGSIEEESDRDKWKVWWEYYKEYREGNEGGANLFFSVFHEIMLADHKVEDKEKEELKQKNKQLEDKIKLLEEELNKLKLENKIEISPNK